MYFRSLPFITIIITGALFASSVFAQPISPTQGTPIGNQFDAFAGKKGAGVEYIKDPRQVAAETIANFLGLLGIAALAYIVYGGSLIMTSAGEEDRMDKGKSVLRNGVIGLLIILSAYGITRLVVSLAPSPPSGANDPSEWSCEVLQQAKVNPDILGGSVNPQQINQMILQKCTVK